MFVLGWWVLLLDPTYIYAKYGWKSRITVQGRFSQESHAVQWSVNNCFSMCQPTARLLVTTRDMVWATWVTQVGLSFWAKPKVTTAETETQEAKAVATNLGVTQIFNWLLALYPWPVTNHSGHHFSHLSNCDHHLCFMEYHVNPCKSNPQNTGKMFLLNWISWMEWKRNKLVLKSHDIFAW